ncbi:Hypothetical Protein PANA_0323 [Pantoea ananatis LMG 20103]|uniref:Uncharacterized protein n=1 Tax=Pantoea ananatis (strain LMG 20103) TaxID=706191 RepID=D4GHH5_PANAM|nr:Hypothetical Protein PANA_0323 [Pantoea ananatis LMG 20103]
MRDEPVRLLHRTFRYAADKLALEKQENHDKRHDNDHRASHQHRDINGVLILEKHHANGQGSQLIFVDQNQRNKEFVPRPDKQQQGQRGDRGPDGRN